MTPNSNPPFITPKSLNVNEHTLVCMLLSGKHQDDVVEIVPVLFLGEERYNDDVRNSMVALMTDEIVEGVTLKKNKKHCLVSRHTTVPQLVNLAESWPSVVYS